MRSSRDAASRQGEIEMRSRNFLRTSRGQRGVSTIEFALVAPILFLLLFVAIDLASLLWVNLTM
jgi:Flp pilus assembly protein TadG